VAPTSDIVIVGGGAVGAACARELAIRGREVLIIEPETEMGQAWRAAAGMLAPQIEADGNDPLLRLALRARDHYDGLAVELRESTGVDLGLWREGIARVALDHADAEALRLKVEWQLGQGFPCEWLDEEELRGRWPWLGPAIGALWAPQDGALDPQRLVKALLNDARRLGATLIRDRIAGIQTAGSRVSGVIGERAPYGASQVVIAAGAWSGQIQGLPRTIPVQPVRGQMAAVQWPSTMERAITYHKDSYLLARGGEAILGSTMEYVGFDPVVTSAGLAQIFSSTLALCPGLVRSKVQRTWAGLRPVTSDGMPVLGAEPRLPGLWYACGHGRNGILLAGLTGVVMAQLICGEPVGLDLRHLGPERFGGMGTAKTEANAP
jgi:glycine oxidase